MDRKQAVEELKTRYLTMSQCLDKEELRKANEAIDLAINALQTEHCEDAISRQAAIDAIHFYCKNICGLSDYNWCLDCPSERFVGLLKELPSVQPAEVYSTKAFWKMIDEAVDKMEAE